MAVVSTTTYLYIDANLTQHFVQGVELVDRGAWSSATAYAIGNVIQIGIDQYIALAANTNAPPTAIVDENWSTLVEVEEEQVVTNAGSDYTARFMGSEALALGTAAYDLAASAYSLGGAAYALAQNGTNLILIETGSRIAADAALQAFVFGSIAVDLAAETGSRIAADSSLQTQITVSTGSLQTQITTETGSRIAADLALQAFVFGSISVDLSAETGSRIAADLVLDGLISDETGSRIAADAALQAFVFGSIGTDLANETLTRAASDQQIISIVNTGTNVANAAYAMAQLGTIIPPLSSLPDVNIPAPSATEILTFDGSRWASSANVNALNYANTHSTLAYAGTVTIDFTAGAKTLALTGDVAFLTTNASDGRMVKIRILGDTVGHYFTFPAWHWASDTPIAQVANKWGWLTLECWGTDIAACYAVEV